jgi:hypothetical protein
VLSIGIKYDGQAAAEQGLQPTQSTAEAGVGRQKILIIQENIK